MAKRSYRDLFQIFEKWLGLIWNLFSKTRVLFGNSLTVG
jgi:hypothetical protein